MVEVSVDGVTVKMITVNFYLCYVSAGASDNLAKLHSFPFEYVRIKREGATAEYRATLVHFIYMRRDASKMEA